MEHQERALDIAIDGTLLNDAITPLLTSRLRRSGYSVGADYMREAGKSRLDADPSLARLVLTLDPDPWYSRVIAHRLSRLDYFVGVLRIRRSGRTSGFVLHAGKDWDDELGDAVRTPQEQTDSLFDLVNILLSPKTVRLEMPPSTVLIDSYAYYDDLLQRLVKDWDHIHTLKPRQFEELVAEMLSRDGFEVTLTKETRDGGIDIFARERKRFGEVVYAYECKLHNPKRPIGVSIVREFATAIRVANVAHGVLCTSTTFSVAAQRTAKSQLIYPQDRHELYRWISEVAHGNLDR